MCSPLGKGLVVRAPGLRGTHCGQEGIQEAARKDGACGEGSAQMQVRFGEVPFHPTELFNKVDVGRIFCKIRGKRERQADKFRNTGLPEQTDQVWGVGVVGEPLLKGTDATMG